MSSNIQMIVPGAARRPPDAAISEEDSLAMLERKATAAMEQRDNLLEQIKTLEAHKAALERHIGRAVTYWSAKWASARRTIKRLIWIGGSVLAVETLALAGLIWRML